MVTRSSTYLVDITKLAHPDDVKSDNFGVWTHSGSHQQLFKVHVDMDGYVQVQKCAPGATGVGTKRGGAGCRAKTA